MIGEFARTPRYQGAGSSQVNPTRVDIALDELARAAPVGATVDVRAGLRGRADAGDATAGDRLRAEAVGAGRRADVVVVFLGLPPSDESEGFDRDAHGPARRQLALLDAVAAANPRVVVVLANGSVGAPSPLGPSTRRRS